MGILDGHKLSDVNRAFRAVFLSALGQASRWSDLISERVPMTRGELRLKFAARSSGVHEWLDERIKSKLRAYETSLVAKKWANGLVIDGADLEDDDDALGLYRPAIAEMADDFVEHKHQLCIDLLNGGFAGTKGLAYDGQFFFDSDHKDGDGAAQTNVSALPLLNATSAPANFYTVRQQMRAIKKPNGLLANLNPTHIIIPQALEATADQLFRLPTLAAGGANPTYNAVEPIIEPRLTSTTAWFLVDAAKPLKPIIHGDRRNVGMRSRTNPNDDPAYSRDQYEWGGDGRYNCAFYFWQLMQGSTGAG